MQHANEPTKPTGAEEMRSRRATVLSDTALPLTGYCWEPAGDVCFARGTAPVLVDLVNNVRFAYRDCLLLVEKGENVTFEMRETSREWHVSQVFIDRSLLFV